MENRGITRTSLITIIGAVLLAIILIGGTVLTGQSAHKDTVDAVRSVSFLYLDELAGRREQVVEDKLNDNISIINIAVDLITEEDLSDLDHMRAYQRQMKQLFNLKRFAFVDTDNLVYTADEGIQNDIADYSFDPQNLDGPSITIKNPDSTNKQVVIAVPVRDKNLYIDGKQLVACFMEIDMDVMLKNISVTSQNNGTTFCNCYTSDGTALTNTVLGGLATEDNLLKALEQAQYEPEYSFEQVQRDFAEGNKGVVSFTYNGIHETLSYAPIPDTSWMLTYLIRDNVISDRIGGITDGIIARSVIQSLLTIVVLGAMFVFIIRQNRKNAQLILDKETSEAENRARHEEMEHRLALQEKVIEQQAHQEEQERMITALASDFRSVYYINLDEDRGVCYQARSDIDGLHAGSEFDYLEAFTAYCNQYVLPEYREEFLRNIQPDAVREGLKTQRVMSFRYMVDIDGASSYEAVRFAGVRHPEDRDDHIVHSVSAGFADIDEVARKEIAEQHALSDALAVAEQASKAKTAFLSNMSHEIRTPMNAIIGLNSIALHDPTVSETVKDYLEKSGASAQHLLGIINDILDMSRIESGRLVIKHEEFSFARCLEQVNTIINGQCQEKGLRYDCRMFGKIDDYYIGDEMKLKQIMINILGNAVKFTPEGGTVTFLIEEGPRYDNKAALKLTFRDTGVGMSEDYLPRLFDPFSQEDSSSTNKYGSTGLGMPITKSFVELMNGTIDVESTKGVGTTFTVTVVLGESSRKDGAIEDGEVNPHEMSVLVIDDDPIALKHARIVLGHIGINCDMVETGAEGIELVTLRHGRQEDYGLLLIDWKMPDMDGVETTRVIRAMDRQDAREIPIIALIANAFDEDVQRSMQAGLDAHLSKPVDPEMLFDTLERLIEG